MGQMCTGDWTFVLSQPCQSHATLLPWGGKLNEFSSDDLCLFARVLLLSRDAGFYAEVTEITLGF